MLLQDAILDVAQRHMQIPELMLLHIQVSRRMADAFVHVPDASLSRNDGQLLSSLFMPLTWQF